MHRLAFYVADAAKNPTATVIEAGVERLREAKFPVTVKELGEQPRYLDAARLGGLMSLDRLARPAVSVVACVAVPAWLSAGFVRTQM